jgi:hypothetical protein
MSKEKRKGKIYRPSFFLRFFALCIMIGAPLQALYLLSTDSFLLKNTIDSLVFGFFLFVLVSIICWQTYLYAFRTYLIVNDDGIGVEGIYGTFTTWDNVEKFGWDGFLKNRRWGIKTIEAVNPTGFLAAPFRKNFIPLSRVVGQPSSKRYEMIVAGFGDDLDKFAQTPLGQDLLHYAPHLFEEKQK